MSPNDPLVLVEDQDRPLIWVDRPEEIAMTDERLDAIEREWLESTPPAGHPLIHGIFQRLPSQLAALPQPATEPHAFDCAMREGGPCDCYLVVPPATEPALDVAYRERNAVVAALIRTNGWPAEVVMAPDTEGWFIVYAETSEGQVSWHIAPDDMDLFSEWPVAFGTHRSPWDGHTTEEKYQRLARLAAQPSADPTLPEEYDEFSPDDVAQPSAEVERLRVAAGDVLTLCDCMALFGKPHDSRCISNVGAIVALRAALAESVQ